MKRHTAVVFDLEFTAWKGSMEARWMRPGEHKEIVQIGAVKIDSQSGEIVEEFDCLMRPRLNPLLSDYFETLTGITEKDLAARGMDFADGFAAFRGFANGDRTHAFGRDDLVLAENLRLYGLDADMPAFADIVPWLVKNGLDPRGLNACDVGPSAGVAFEGRRHNALDDARSVAQGIKALLDRGADNPFSA
jgi:inhibitor of KinA sporulation pathway (predicted exonuclease)